jgi:hypothetical protein
MTKNLVNTIIIIFILFLLSCNTSESNQNIPNLDTNLYTGFYFINDTATSLKRQLIKTNDVYNIDPTPIITAKNFDKVEMFHEKDCYALFIWLDKKGSQLLDIAKQSYKGKKFALIVNNQLLRIQLVDDPQFATVGKKDDTRIYGQVLVFPCNSFLPAELKNYETIISNEK